MSKESSCETVAWKGDGTSGTFSGDWWQVFVHGKAATGAEPALFFFVEEDLFQFLSFKRIW